MRNDNEIRVCIVGAGKFASRRIYPYIIPGGAKLVGICTRSIESSTDISRMYGGTQYDDLKVMLNSEKPDCVIICVGPQEHPALAMLAMRMGYPVYTEKPQSMSSTDSIEMAKTSKETGVLCTIAYKKRYAKVFSRAKEWINQFPQEKLSSISVDCSSGAFSNDKPENSFLLQCGIHIIDLFLFLFGNVQEVFCFARGHNAYSINIRFSNGALGTMNLNDTGSMTVPTEEFEIGVDGGNFMRIHNSSEYKICENGKCVEWCEPSTFMSSGDSGHDTGLLTEIVDFFEAVRENRTTRSNIYESCKTMKLYEAIIQSSQTGDVVEIDYSDILSFSE